MTSLAAVVDVLIGVDTHEHTHTAAVVVAACTGGELDVLTASARPDGYAAFVEFGGVRPIPASTGQTVHHRLNRYGDRELNRALHRRVSRLRYDEATCAYRDRRQAQGKTDREIRCCLTRYVARQLYRQP